MKASELRELDMNELKAEHVRLLRAQMNNRIKRTNDMLSENHLVKETRRDIARVKTIMREKRNGGN